MTFASKVTEVGRHAATVLELDLDACSRSYGVSPCTADLALRNDLNYSNQFEQATGGSTPGWTGTSLTTANAVNAPDGTLTADEFARIGTGSIQMESLQDRTIGLSVEATNTAQAFRMCVKPKLVGGVVSERYFGISHFTSGTTVAGAWFDIQDGHSMGTFGSDTVFHHYIRYMDEATESGWYEVGVIYDSDSVPGTAQVGFFVTNANFDISTSGDIGDGVYIAWAQVRPLSAVGLAGTFTGPYVYGKYAPRTTTVVDGMGDPSADLCYNTFATCQDTANYLKEVRTYRFIDDILRPPDAVDIYPAVKSVRYSSTRLQPGGKYSARGQVTVSLQDFADGDWSTDDYQHLRDHNQENQGTFFGKFLERNKFYIGRPMRVKEGFIDPDTFSLTDFRTREYIIDSIAGPTSEGKVTITGKDVLALARDDRAKAPTASTWTLRAAMNSSQTTLLPQIGEAASIVAGDKHIRVNDEIMLVGTESPTDTVNVTRAQGGTTAASHAIDDTVQECLTYEDEPVIDVIDDLLKNFANVPSAFIPYTDWETEETESLTGYNLETIISAPTGVTKLLQEISESTLIDLWYSDVDQEIKLKLQTPFTAVTETWDDDDHIVADSIKVRNMDKDRLSRVVIYYGMRNFAEKLTEPENYQFINFEIEADKEGVNKYDDERVRVIFSRWFDSTNSQQVALTSQRLLDRFGITPVEVTFDIDAKDVETLDVGDVYDLRTRVIQNVAGLPKTTRFQITESKPKNVGHRYTYKSLAFFQDPTPDTLTITANDSDYDVFVELGGPPGPIDATLTINSGVDVTATTGNPAITTVGMHPDSTLRIVNNGDILGHGGAGGSGKNVQISSEFESTCIEFNFKSGGSAGSAGGDAIYTTIDLTIDNTNGNIWAGAGGGGGGDSYEFENVGYGGGGGGGGIGTDTANGGAAGTATAIGFNCFGTPIVADGGAGGGGTTSAAGSGGAAGGAGAGAGGAGGADWGDDGSTGGSGGFSGGVGGYAIRLNGNTVTWEAGNTAAKVKGDVA